ncbi:MAG: undecaprenyldiphospho-muramoylpentapeptide beta-N-acetylglucosaminyltransferase [Candidatus Omnitrophica bacterium]|nr:undecaprenyldiphospho-muramoylpentapeptide beta-N-acetylglucosaminyltransferase [Candidatus Omnitrophota bacterium]
MKTLILAGGSGGHLIPALALGEHLGRQGECLLVSTQRPVDQILRTQTSLRWETTPLEPFTPLSRWLSVRHWARQLSAAWRMLGVLRRTRPDVVVGFGGYPSLVGMVLARAAGFPTVLHEANVVPGRANRWLSRWVDAVAVSFPETRQGLSARAVVEVTGNPLRPGLREADPARARRFFGLDETRPVLLVMGGSQGSRAVNQLVLAMWEGQAAAFRQGWQVLHVAGCDHRPAVEGAYRRLGMNSKVFGFLQEMPMALACAALSISRAGATAVSELAACQVPAILIPYPHAQAHQRSNAQWMRDLGGAVILEEAGLKPGRLAREFQDLAGDPSRRQRMRQALKGASQDNAVEALASLARRMADGGAGG